MKIVVFDSGFGSLSIIKEIQKRIKSNLVYFADQKNYPYGKKSKKQLLRIINKTIETISKKFKPDLIILASNTPSLLLRNNLPREIITVLPPLKNIGKSKKNHNIAILGTESVVKSNEINDYIKDQISSKKIKVVKINSSALVDLVETGKFITDPDHCIEVINKILRRKFLQYKIDIATLSSTHLPFLLPFLKEVYPNIKFLDPANMVAKMVSKKYIQNEKIENKLQIFTTGNPKKFQSKLKKLGIKNKVTFFSL